MATNQRDLWPSDISVLPDIPTPLSILREKASLLGEKTNNLVEAEVRSHGNKSDQFVHTFFLVAPALDNYRYPLLTVTHKIELYPLTISFSGLGIQVNNPDQFTDELRKIFADEKTKSVIQVLVAQSCS